MLLLPVFTAREGKTVCTIKQGDQHVVVSSIHDTHVKVRQSVL